MNLHASHRHDGNESQLALSIHIQRPNERQRQKREREITNDAEGTVEVGEGDDNLHGNAVTIQVRVPKEFDGRALEKGDKKEDDARKDGDEHDAVNDPDVDSSDGDAQEEPANGYFRGDHRCAIP